MNNLISSKLLFYALQHTVDIILWLKCCPLNNNQFIILWKRDLVCLKEPRKDHLGTHLHHNPMHAMHAHSSVTIPYHDQSVSLHIIT